jgi:signal transduction histidine kinase
MMSKLFPTLSLKLRIVLMVFVLLIAAIWGLAARVAGVAHSDLENAQMQSMSASVRYIAADLDSDLQLRIDVLKGVAASIPPAALDDAAKVRHVLEQRRVSPALFPLGLVVANKEGTYVADYPPGAGRLGASISDSAFFRRLMAGAEQAVSAPLIGRSAEQPLFRLGVPLRDSSGAAAGVLFGAWTTSDLNLFGNLEQFKVGLNGFISVLSAEDHLIVASTDRERAMSKLPPKGVNPLLDRRLEEGFEGPGITRTSFGLDILSVARRMHTTGWLVAAGESQAEFFAPIAALERQIYLAALLISLAVAAVLAWVLARQLAPLKAGADALRRMTEGKQPLAPLPVGRHDEIGELIGSFNQLVAERLRLDTALREEVGAHTQAEEALDKALKRLQALSERMTSAQEEQRRKIAFELHEQAGQELTTLMIHLQMLEAHCGGEQARVHLQEASTIAGLALQRVRAMSLDLHPPQLAELGLYTALRGHCRQQAEVAGWSMHFDAPETGERLHRDVEIACFRVVQEALTNVAQHAQATQVWVSLRENDGGLQLNVRDNGIGFDVAAVGEHIGQGGFGLTAMGERVRQVAGRMHIRSSPGSGTEIELRLFSQFRLF